MYNKFQNPYLGIRYKAEALNRMWFIIWIFLPVNWSALFSFEA